MNYCVCNGELLIVNFCDDFIVFILLKMLQFVNFNFYFYVKLYVLLLKKEGII